MHSSSGWEGDYDLFDDYELENPYLELGTATTLLPEEAEITNNPIGFVWPQ